MQLKQKLCPHCKILKPHSDYHKASRQKDGIAWECKECRKRHDRSPERKKYWRDRYHADGGATFRNNTFQLKYGITLNDYHKMLEEQGSCCAICGTRQEELTRRLAVDHCHTTGKVRGLLCNRCNVLIAQAQDVTETLRKAIIYLERTK